MTSIAAYVAAKPFFVLWHRGELVMVGAIEALQLAGWRSKAVCAGATPTRFLLGMGMPVNSALGARSRGPPVGRLTAQALRWASRGQDSATPSRDWMTQVEQFAAHTRIDEEQLETHRDSEVDHREAIS